MISMSNDLCRVTIVLFRLSMCLCPDTQPFYESEFYSMFSFNQNRFHVKALAPSHTLKLSQIQPRWDTTLTDPAIIFTWHFFDSLWTVRKAKQELIGKSCSQPIKALTLPTDKIIWYSLTNEEEAISYFLCVIKTIVLLLLLLCRGETKHTKSHVFMAFIA